MSEPTLPPGWSDPEIASAMTLTELFERRRDYRIRKLHPDTVRYYQRCIQQFGEHLGHAPTIDDLSVDPLIDFAEWSVEQGCCAITANSRVKQLRALWTFAFEQQLMTRTPPSQCKIPENRPVIDVWTAAELERLFAAAAESRGWIGPHAAADWWLAVLWIAWNTGERAGAIWRLRPEHFRLDDGELEAPAEVRKDSRVGMRWLLTPSCVEVVRRVAERSEAVLLTQPWATPQSCYRHYRALLRRAGLPTGRRCGLQKMRRTVASWIKLRGGDPGVWLGHAPKTVADGHYVDRWTIQQARRNTWPIDTFDPQDQLSDAVAGSSGPMSGSPTTTNQEVCCE